MFRKLKLLTKLNPPTLPPIVAPGYCRSLELIPLLFRCPLMRPKCKPSLCPGLSRAVNPL